jgi:hypothetical protein
MAANAKAHWRAFAGLAILYRIIESVRRDCVVGPAGLETATRPLGRATGGGCNGGAVATARRCRVQPAAAAAGSLMVGSSSRARSFPCSCIRPAEPLIRRSVRTAATPPMMASSLGDTDAPLVYAVEMLERNDGVDFPPMIFREGQEGEHVGLGISAAAFGTFGRS